MVYDCIVAKPTKKLKAFCMNSQWQIKHLTCVMDKEICTYLLVKLKKKNSSNEEGTVNPDERQKVSKKCQNMIDYLKSKQSDPNFVEKCQKIYEIFEEENVLWKIAYLQRRSQEYKDGGFINSVQQFMRRHEFEKMLPSYCIFW